MPSLQTCPHKKKGPSAVQAWGGGGERKIRRDTGDLGMSRSGGYIGGYAARRQTSKQMEKVETGFWGEINRKSNFRIFPIQNLSWKPDLLTFIFPMIVEQAGNPLVKL